MSQWKPIVVKSYLTDVADQQSGVLKWSDLTLLENDFYDYLNGNVGPMGGDGGGIEDRLLAVRTVDGELALTWQDVYTHPPYAPALDQDFVINIGLDTNNNLDGVVDFELELDSDPGVYGLNNYSFSADQINTAQVAGHMATFHQTIDWQGTATYPANINDVRDTASSNVVGVGIFSDFDVTLSSDYAGHVTATTATGDDDDQAGQAASLGQAVNLSHLPICIDGHTDSAHNCITVGAVFSGDYNANHYIHKIHNSGATDATSAEKLAGPGNTNPLWPEQGVSDDATWGGDFVTWHLKFQGGPLDNSWPDSPQHNYEAYSAEAVANKVRILKTIAGGMSNNEVGHPQNIAMTSTSSAWIQSSANWLVVDEPVGHVNYNGSGGVDSYFSLVYADIDVDAIPAAKGSGLDCAAADIAHALCQANQYGNYKSQILLSDRLTGDRQSDKYRWWNMEVTGDFSGSGEGWTSNTFKIANDPAVSGESTPTFHFSGDDTLLASGELIEEFSIKGNVGTVVSNYSGREYNQSPSGTEKMDTPITVVAQSNQTHYTDTTLPNSGLIPDGPATLVTIAGIYGDNNRIRVISSGDGMNFSELNTADLQSGNIHLGAPSNLSSSSTDNAAGNTHTHAIPTTADGSNPSSGPGEWQTVLRTTSAINEIGTLAAGSLVLEKLIVRGSYSEGVGDNLRTTLTSDDSAIADQVIQLNVNFSQLPFDGINPHCSNSSTGNNDTGYDNVSECQQTDGTCTCANGTNSGNGGTCLSDGTENYADCSALSDFVGSGDGAGGAATDSEWVADFVWITTAVSNYGAAMPMLGQNSSGVVFGNDPLGGLEWQGGFLYYGDPSSAVTGATEDKWGEEEFTPLYIKDTGDAAVGGSGYKGLEIGDVTWTNAANYSDDDVPSVIYGIDGYVAVLGSSSVIGSTAPTNLLTDGVLLVKDFYSSGANAGELWINPQVASNASSWSNYYNTYDDANGETGSGYNLALGIGSQGDDGDGSAIQKKTGGYLECQYLTLGDVGDVTDNSSGAESIANMIDNQTDTIVNGMVVAQYETGGGTAAGGMDGSLFLIVQE